MERNDETAEITVLDVAQTLVEQMKAQADQMIAQSETLLDLLAKAQRNGVAFDRIEAKSPRPKSETSATHNSFITRGAPRFSEVTSAEKLIVDWVVESGREWRAIDLIRHLTRHSNISEYVGKPDDTIYQALSRAVRKGQLTKPRTGTYAPASAESAA